MARFPKGIKATKISLGYVADAKARYGIGLRTEKLIGRFVAAWSRVEAIIGDIVWVILDVSAEDGRVITARIGPEMKISWIKTFAERHVPPEMIDHLSPAVNMIEGLLDDRNFIVHGSWGRLDDGTPVVASLRPKTDPDKVVIEYFDDDRLEGLIARAEAVRDLLIAWRKLHEASPGRRTAPLYSGEPNPPGGSAQQAS